MALASSELLGERTLLRRVDTKFTLPLGRVSELIDAVAKEYRIVETGGELLANYETLYFDDDALSCYQAHRTGQVPRCKVRIRRYADRDLTFLELKRRLHHEICEKHRWQLPDGTRDLNATLESDMRAIETQLPVALKPRLWTNFRRATLLSETTSERLTIDSRLVFRDGHKVHRLERLVVIEVKQAVFSEDTSIMRTLRRAGIHPRAISKYCSGTQLLRLG